MTQDVPPSGMPPMIGVCLSIEAWHDYVAAYDFGPLAPSKVVLHHTWRPTESQWRGLDSMRSMQASYARKGWTAAPHLYVAPDGIWLFTPLREIGIHANAGNGSLVQGWYSIGVEMVGDYDQVRPSGVIWEATKAVIGGLSRKLAIAPRQLLAFHREYNNTKSCPGWAVTKDWVFAEVDGWLASQAAPDLPFFDQSPILGPWTGTAESYVQAWLTRCAHTPYTPFDVRAIAERYWNLCLLWGLEPWMVAAQVMHETDDLTSFWGLRPRRNPAGIGVDGSWSALHLAGYLFNPQRQRWEQGLSFATWAEDAIPAHLGRLLAYALPSDQRSSLQQRIIDRALRYRALDAQIHGSAPVWQRLGKVHNSSGHGWADPGTDYGARIAAMANRLRGGT